MKKKTKYTLDQDMPYSLIDSLQKAIKECVNIKQKFYYWHDKDPKGRYMLHIHKLKCPTVLSRSTLYKICDHLEELGFYGFQPTSEDAENWSGIARYHKARR